MRQGQRGVALITVLLVLLILTALGIAASMMMTREDRTSSRQDLQRAALYAAEVGLRRGEQTLNGISFSDASTILSHVPQRIQGWTGSQTDAPVGAAATWSVENLGTYLIPNVSAVAADELVNQPIAIGAYGGISRNYQALYSLYLRNNPEDLAATITSDTDSRVRLTAVGFIISGAYQLVNGNELTGNYQVVATKILEEEFGWRGSSQGASTQKQINAGGTGEIRVQAEPD
jgi:Tfp pilus assembly protein PilV